RIAPRRVATDTNVAFLFSTIRRTGLAEKTGYTLGASGLPALPNQSLFSSASVLASTVEKGGRRRPTRPRPSYELLTAFLQLEAMFFRENIAGLSCANI